MSMNIYGPAAKASPCQWTASASADCCSSLDEWEHVKTWFNCACCFCLNIHLHNGLFEHEVFDTSACECGRLAADSHQVVNLQVARSGIT